AQYDARARAHASWGFTSKPGAKTEIAGRKNRGIFGLSSKFEGEGACLFADLDRALDEIISLRFPGEDALLPGEENTKVTARPWRLPRGERPRCEARTRSGSPCKRAGLRNGRCPNHGGLSTGPKSKAGRSRIAAAQTKRWIVYRVMKNN